MPRVARLATRSASSDRSTVLFSVEPSVPHLDREFGADGQRDHYAAFVEVLAVGHQFHEPARHRRAAGRLRGLANLYADRLGDPRACRRVATPASIRSSTQARAVLCTSSCGVTARRGGCLRTQSTPQGETRRRWQVERCRCGKVNRCSWSASAVTPIEGHNLVRNSAAVGRSRPPARTSERRDSRCRPVETPR